MLIDEIKNIIKHKNKSKIEDDKIISLALDEAINEIKEHCNIDELNDKLMYIAGNVAVDILDSQYTDEKCDSEGIKSLQQGDTTIHFSDKKKVITKDNYLDNYKKSLNRYRRLRK